MGQQGSRLPRCSEELQEELERLLELSSNVIASADTITEAGPGFLVDFDDIAIDNKVDGWLNEQQPRIAATEASDFDPEQENLYEKAFVKLGLKTKGRMRKEYEQAYDELRHFYEYVDQLAEQQRKIHAKLLKLERLVTEDTTKFSKKFPSLRIQTLENYRKSEKLAVRDRKIKHDLVKRVDDIDYTAMGKCRKKMTRLIEMFEEKDSD